MSMLERLMNDELYMKDPDTKKYDSDYVTKLVNSFRSHPDILKIPNELYYEGELKVCADELQRNRFCNWEVLPNDALSRHFIFNFSSHYSNFNQNSIQHQEELMHPLTHIIKLQKQRYQYH